MTKDKQIEALREALRPFAKAYIRMRSYGVYPADDTPLFAGADGGWTLYELIDGEEGPTVKVGDLRLAREVLNCD